MLWNGSREAWADPLEERRKQTKAEGYPSCPLCAWPVMVGQTRRNVVAEVCVNCDYEKPVGH